MNRAERRAKGIKEKEPVINIKVSEIEAMKQDAVKKAVDKAFFLMLAIPTMVIHDKFGKLMKRQGEDGSSREARFTDEVLELYDTFQKGYVSIPELHQCLLEEVGIDVSHLLKGE